MEKCKNCGCDNTDDAKFCAGCGKAVEHRANGGCPVVGKAAALKTKAAAFEQKHCLIVNALIAVLAIVFLFVALFAPVKTVNTDVSLTDGASSVGKDKYSYIETYEAGQSIWQILGSVKYLSLDSENARDMYEIGEIFADAEKAEECVAREYEIWLARHPYATKKQANDKYRKLYDKYMSDVNMLGYQFAFTTVGALDNIFGQSVEKEMTDTLDTMRNTALFSFVTALVSVALRLGVAVTSVIFAAFAIAGILRRKQTKLFTFLTAVIALSGAELAVLSVAPLLTAGGAAFAILLTGAIAFTVCGAVKAVTDGKGATFAIKRVLHSALTLTALCLLCSFTVTLLQTSFAGNGYDLTETSAPLGAAIESILAVLSLKSVAGVKITYSAASPVVCVAAAVLGLIAFAALLAALLLSLRQLAFGKVGKRRADVMSLVGAVALILFAVVPAVIGTVDKMPVTADRSSMAMQIQIFARSYVYVSLAFAVAAFLTDLIIVSGKSDGALCGSLVEPSATDGNIGAEANLAVEPTPDASEEASASEKPAAEKPAPRKKKTEVRA